MPWNNDWQGPSAGAVAVPSALVISSVSISGTTATVTVNGDAGISNKVYYGIVGVAGLSTSDTLVGDGIITITGLIAGRRYLFIGQSFNGTTPSVIAAASIAYKRVNANIGPLLVSPAAIIAEYLINSLSKMTDPSDGGSWPLFISHLPDGDGSKVEQNAGVIYDTTGVSEIRQMDGFVPEHPGIQLRIRNRDFQTGFAKIEDLALALDSASDEAVVLNSVNYNIRNISRATPIVPLGVEPGTKRRFHFTVNYLTTIKKVT